MGILGDIVGGVAGFVVAGPVGAVGGVALAEMLDSSGNSSSPAPNPTTSPAPDYSAAMLVQSNNGKETALAQIQSQEFALQQSSVDREMQNSANLELGLANFDTKLQTSKLDYFQAMKAESDRHTEKLASIAADVPPPEGL